jgi:hypothetical protein
MKTFSILVLVSVLLLGVSTSALAQKHETDGGTKIHISVCMGCCGGWWFWWGDLDCLDFLWAYLCLSCLDDVGDCLEDGIDEAGDILDDTAEDLADILDETGYEIHCVLSDVGDDLADVFDDF